MKYLRNRRLRKTAEGLLHHARHLLHMREDVMDSGTVEQLKAAEQGVHEALGAGDASAIETACERITRTLDKVAPARPHASLRENLEVLLVAVVVAMAFRTYFLQPFKIPTGSMQPSLYGIHYEPADKPGVMDQFPLSLVNRVLFGQGYMEIRASASGRAMEDPQASDASSVEDYYIGGRPHRIPKGLSMHFGVGDYVVAGQLLASGFEFSGDHLFVDKVRWNFVCPKRGQIMVFETRGIAGITPNIHYIKRMVGLPGEDIAIDPPCIRVKGQRLAEPPPGIARVQNMTDGYYGYQFASTREFRSPEGAWFRCRLAGPDESIHLASDQYLGFGDNTPNSLDGRYWGPVPRQNLVGPALFVYWPLSRRFGLAR